MEALLLADELSHVAVGIRLAGSSQGSQNPTAARDSSGDSHHFDDF
jgi:hypothetical protein